MVEQLEEALRVSTCECLGIDPNATGKDAAAVRVAWPEEDSPFPKHGEDVTFLYVEIANDPISQERSRKFVQALEDGELLEDDQYILVIQARWSCYGKNAGRNAFGISEGLFYRSVADMNAKNGLFLTERISTPQRFSELVQTRWWTRYDVTAKFNFRMSREMATPWLLFGGIVIKEG